MTEVTQEFNEGARVLSLELHHDGMNDITNQGQVGTMLQNKMRKNKLRNCLLLIIIGCSSVSQGKHKQDYTVWLIKQPGMSEHDKICLVSCYSSSFCNS